MYDEHRQLTYNQVIGRDERRFKAADRDGDDKLNREEYGDFIHPGLLLTHNAMHITVYFTQCTVEEHYLWGEGGG